MTQAFNLSQLANGVDSSGKLDLSTNSKNPSWTTDITANQVTVGRGGGNIGTNTAIGQAALSGVNTNTYSVAVGYTALQNNTSGGQNTAVGGQTLVSNTTGSTNTAVGFQSLQVNTASGNTGVGGYALNVNTTGASNVAVGQQALGSNTTGQRSTAIGYQAGYSQTTADSNTFIGHTAGYGVTGNYSVAVGRVALNASCTADNNTAIGYAAMNSATSGANNTAVGWNALSSSTTGSNNTAVGYSAGSANTTNSNNTYIGYTCGSSHIGAGCIFIGPNAFSGYNGSNQIVFKTGDGREALYADIGGGGSFRQYSNSATWAVVSDQRVKEKIVEITNGLEKIVALRPVTFDYITSKEHNAGFIAQEFQNVLPDQVKLVKARPEEAELVGEDEIYTIQQNLTPYLVKAIQELKTIVDAQAAEIAELKAKVA